VPALIRVSPYSDPPDSGLQHLVSVEASVFPKHCVR